MPTIKNLSTRYLLHDYNIRNHIVNRQSLNAVLFFFLFARVSDFFAVLLSHLAAITLRQQRLFELHLSTFPHRQRCLLPMQPLLKTASMAVTTPTPLARCAACEAP